MDSESAAFQSNYSLLVGSSVWTHLATPTASDGASSDYFSKDIAIADGLAIVSAYGNTADTGAAYVFAGSGDSWSEQAKLVASDAAAGDSFGWSISLSTKRSLYKYSL